jgi:hypothetical protein
MAVRAPDDGRNGNTAPQGPARPLFAADPVGTSAETAERLRTHAPFREVDKVAFALPFAFGQEDRAPILTGIATKAGPGPGRQAAGWDRGRPGTTRCTVAHPVARPGRSSRSLPPSLVPRRP